MLGCFAAIGLPMGFPRCVRITRRLLEVVASRSKRCGLSSSRLKNGGMAIGGARLFEGEMSGEVPNVGCWCAKAIVERGTSVELELMAMFHMLRSP
jgi:hypothetical protein